MTNNKPKLLTDRVFAVLMLFLAFSYGYLSLSYRPTFGPEESVGPQTFPMIIAVILGLSALSLLFKPQQTESWAKPKIWLELILTIIALLVFAYFLEIVGFILAGTLCCGFISWRMGAKPLYAFLIALIYSVVLFVVFDLLLDLSLPLGFFEGIV